MKLLKWVTHPIYLLILITGAAVFLNRGLFFGDPQADSEVAAPPPEEVSEAGFEEMKPAIPVLSEQTHELTATGKVETPSSNEQITEADAIDPVKGAAATPNQDADESQAEGVAGRNEVVSAPAESAHNEPQPEPRQLWREARTAAWQGNLEQSEQLYREFAKASPTSIDAFGELGNVLMRKGDWKAAAQAYFQAALRAHDTEQPETAWYLHSVIAGLDHDLAIDLRQRLGAN